MPENNPPSYHSVPLVLAETMTTRPEIVTTTTTEIITHSSSSPNWKKRKALSSISQQHHHTVAPQLSPPPSSTLFVDKDLPPTPPAELPDDYIAPIIRDTPKFTAFTTDVSLPQLKLPQSRKSIVGPQSAAALAHAALGVGLPHASTSFSSLETNFIPFGSPLLSPLSLPSTPSPSVRRVKSLHRTRPTTADHENGTKGGQQFVERRRRGVSFGTTSFLSIGNSELKEKAKDVDIRPPVSEPALHGTKHLSRKTSFWNRKKETQLSETTVLTPVQDNTIPVLPPLPQVYRTSPFNIADFPITIDDQAKSSRPRKLSRSQSEGIRMTPPNISIIPALTSPSASSPQIIPSNSEILEPLQSNGRSSLSMPQRQTTSPFLHRLSLGVFTSGEISPAPSLSSGNSHSTSSTSQQFLRRQNDPIPKPLVVAGESPEIYLERLKLAVSKVEIAGILASSSDPFYSSALQAYINHFDFLDIPLDVALRKLLMEVGLPRETQQIDRVMEAFASRYMRCNSDIFTSEDHPYILAFSLIMLHTDAFNPSNKRKMSKVDYIKNTKLPGIATEVLDYFFDNIVFAPFIFIEDPVDFSKQPGLVSDIARSMSVNSPSSALPSASGQNSFRIGNKVDPYYLITNNLLQPLRVDVNSYVPLESPFTYEGTSGPWNEEEVHQAFINARVMEIHIPTVGRATSPFNRNSIENPTPLVASGTGYFSDSSPSKVETWNIKITKVGQLNRKDDVTEGGRKSSNRKWKPWSVILTSSQLLLFRDLAWVSALLNSFEASSEHILCPPSSEFRPDESFSLKDAIVVYDRSYSKYKHTMRFILPDGRQILLQAQDENDLNEWISRINYASAFKSNGVRMRPPGLSGEHILLTGVAAATSHLHDLQKHPNPPRSQSWDSNAPHDLMDMLSGSPTPLNRRVTTTSGNGDFDLDVPVAPEIEGAEQFKATFDQVKADLAAVGLPENNIWFPEEDIMSEVCDSPVASPRSFKFLNSRPPSRSRVIQSKIRDIELKLSASQSLLDSDLKLIRNIAILTPFQKSTRSRLRAGIQNMANRITQIRLEVERLKCHRVVLRCDLSSEERSWNHSKQVALRVAKETLQSRRGHGAPRMTLSLIDDLSPSAMEDLFHLPDTARPHLSTDSFHSTAECESAWPPSSEELTFLPKKSESPKVERSRSMASLSSAPISRSMSSSSGSNHLDRSDNKVISSSSDADVQGDDELAEDWDRTRCAHRVSLIHVPSNIKISVKLKDPLAS